MDAAGSIKGKQPMGWGKAALIALVVWLFLAAVALLSGCANVTVVKLAELCHANEGHPNSTFTTDTGKVDCK